MQTISPCLWFDHEAEDAAKFYVSLFRDSRINKVARYSEAGPRPAGSVMMVNFELMGQDYLALNGGPNFTMTPAISFVVHCENQAEIDRYWDALLDGGKAMQCGWLTDRFGVTWQIVPKIIGALADDSDPARAARVARAMFQMVKLDIAGLQRAYDAA
jgi:predicted 3-demethylubiquinone-9 3-methyltransferase (glyoxalase superfamily)